MAMKRTQADSSTAIRFRISAQQTLLTFHAWSLQLCKNYKYGRFVELLWQLSAHALREVHRRNFPSDIASNPLPVSLTKVVTQNSHAAALLSVTKARIALERRRFLDGALAAVRRQALWSSLAHDMTVEFRALCAEEAYLHQELEKIQEMQNLKGRVEHADHKTITVARASQLWESWSVRFPKLKSLLNTHAEPTHGAFI